MKERYVPRPRLIKRSAESGVQLVSKGEQPSNEIYNSLLQTMIMAHLKPSGYEEAYLLYYDLLCPSVQKLAEEDGSRYHCEFAKCNSFTSLELAKLHLKVTGDKRLAIQAA